MQRKFTLTFAAICLASNAFADVNSSSQINMETKLQNLDAQIKQLQVEKKQNNQQIKKLAKQIDQLKTTINNNNATLPVLTPIPTSKNTQAVLSNSKNQAILNASNVYTPFGNYQYAPVIYASPYITGVDPAYDGSDLIINWSSINEDLALLKQRKRHEDILKQLGLPYPDRPIISLSGYLEARAFAQNTFQSATKSDIDLNEAKIDVTAEVGEWAHALVAIAYDRGSPSGGGARYSNSRIYLDRGLLTIGNLNKTPLYGTIGQYYVPFGIYSNYMIVDPMTKTMARTKARALELGFFKNGIYSAVYAFKGDSYVEGHDPAINNGGLNLGYKFTKDKFTSDVGVSYIMNMADSRGMQSTGGSGSNSTFNGFSSNGASEALQHQVPAGDAHATFTYGSYSLIAEYVSALRSFDIEDMMYNNQGATPSAFNIQAVYKFSPYNKPSFVSANYGQTWQALALNLPRQSLVATLGTSLWKCTVEKLEYRHELNYAYGDTASGGNLSGVITPTGSRIANIAMFQIDVFF